ncbi:MAG TPA: histidine phosphatase family protein [Acidimicrobiia bacterium]|nr:histidine phosphatase family protein [Acidimicrobiia bacterium]
MIILVRHGQTSANAGGLLCGRADVELTELGARQAKALATAIGTPARVISSPLQRARDTAAAFGRPVEIDDRWIELDYGALDLLAYGDVPAEVWRQWRADCEYIPEGGESLTALGRRVREACAEVADAAATEDIVVVTHVSPIKAAIAWALDTGDDIAWRLYVRDASVHRILTGAPGPRLVAFNESYPPPD